MEQRKELATRWLNNITLKTKSCNTPKINFNNSVQVTEEEKRLAIV